MKDVHDLEVYACIDDYPDYLITSKGRVLSLKGEQIKELKQFNCKYTIENYVYLCKNGNKKCFSVDKLYEDKFSNDNYDECDKWDNYYDECY